MVMVMMLVMVMPMMGSNSWVKIKIPYKHATSRKGN